LIIFYEIELHFVNNWVIWLICWVLWFW